MDATRSLKSGFVGRREATLETPCAVGIEELLGPLPDPVRRAAPRELYLRGDRMLLEYGPRVAVVGSRRASRQGLEWTRLVTEVLVDRDITVVSGLAMGADTMAHRTALDRGGNTVAVLGTGLDQLRGREQPGTSGRDRQAWAAGVAVSHGIQAPQVELPAPEQDHGAALGRDLDRGGGGEQRNPPHGLGGHQARPPCALAAEVRRYGLRHLARRDDQVWCVGL